MSFIGGGSECAANANPLAQFSKHAQTDTSLQQSLRNGNAVPMQNGQLRETRLMNQNDHMQLDEFVNQRPGSSFDFQPMMNEINMMHTPSPAMQQPLMMNNNTNTRFQAEQIQNQGQTASGGAWTSEFSNAGQITQNVSHQQTLPQAPLQGLQHRTGMMRPMMMGGGLMGSGGLMAMGRNLQRESQAMSTDTAQEDIMSNDQWEDTFKEFEAAAALKQSEAQEQEERFEQSEAAAEGAFDQVWDDVQKSYADGMLTNDEFQAQWEKDFEKYAQTRLNYGEYHFESKNQFLNNPDAYEIGIKLMESGAKLSEAALAFEAAVQENPGHVDAWLRLGQVQTQNEKEVAGIAALEKCLDLSPQQLTALMTLAISYVNEGYDNAAYATLERWIETKYPSVAEQARISNPDIQADDRLSLNKRVTELFIKAAQLSPDEANMDADVQTGLGVLFYSMEQYEKTMDCFQAAIDVRPDDALAWNRLGASLANSNRPEQAIEAYSKALQLNPNFVRARYNLGVSFINMGMYKDAVEHLLTGLSMHEVETVDDGSGTSGSFERNSNQSTSLIETLKRAFLAMDRRDLIDKIHPGMNIELFRKTYGV